MFRLRSDDIYYPRNLNGIQTEELRLCSVYVPMINITEVSDLNENGLKAQKRLAQGNALGERCSENAP